MTSEVPVDNPQDLFVELIQSFSQRVGLDPQHIFNGGSFLFEGVEFNLVHHAQGFAPMLLMYCDFGVVPADLQLYAYRTLLETNLTTYSGMGENFALSKQGNVVYSNCFLLEVMTTEMLVMHLALAAVYATNWKDGNFNASAGKNAARDKFTTLFKQ